MKEGNNNRTMKLCKAHANTQFKGISTNVEQAQRDTGNKETGGI